MRHFLGHVLTVGFLALLALPAESTGKEDMRGVIVEESESSGAAFKAGLLPGDLLFSWERPVAPQAGSTAATALFSTPFDLLFAEYAEGVRGPLVLRGLRGGKALVVQLAASPWKLTVLPRLSNEERALWDTLSRQLRTEEFPSAVETLDALSAMLREQRLASEAAWLFFRGGQVAAKARRWRAAEELYDRALALEGSKLGPLERAWIYDAKAEASEGENDMEGAKAAYERARVARQEAGGEGLLYAVSLIRTGILAAKRGDLSLARERLEMALAIREREAPHTFALAAVLSNLGTVARDQGELDEAESLNLRALALREEFAPDSLDLAGSYNNLGVVALDRGDLANAERLFQRATAIKERLSPGSLEVAASLNNLGIVELERGDLASAEEHFGSSLATRVSLAPGSLAVAQSLNNLGNIAWARGELDLAESFYLKALAIREKLAPGSQKVAANLTNLGVLARDRGDLTAAEAFHQKAMVVFEALQPRGIESAVCHDNLGAVALDREDIAVAETHYRTALAIQEKLAPGSLGVARSMLNLCNTAQKRGDIQAAEEWGIRAQGLYSRLAPGSFLEAESLHSVGMALQGSGRHAEAASFYLRALDALEAQVGMLGGSDEARTAYSAGLRKFYLSAIEALVDLGRNGEAFSTLERSRARQMLAIIAERDLVFSADIPEDMDQRRRILITEYQRAMDALSLASAGTEPELLNARERVDAAKAALADLKEAIKRASPRLASLQYPVPLDLKGALAALDPGTVALTWSIGEERSHLFVLGGKGLSVCPLPMGRSALAVKIRRVRQQILSKGEVDTRELSKLLLGPARKEIAKARRIMILPDGPLHLLPMATLRDPCRPSRYLIERCPLHTAVSMTVYAEIKKSWAERTRLPLVIFGDPAYSEVPAGEAERDPPREADRGGLKLLPMPAARQEAQGIERLFPDLSTIHLGENATEEAVKAVGPRPTLLHLACHGITDERFPLNSALVLSPSEGGDDGKGRKENGLLQAWEIFEQMRITADLVTLSACETGLGKEMGGEGIIGLTRAFQYAGAQSVLSSLWSVSDASTAELMKRFYTHLKAGMPKAEALRLAQVEMIHGVMGGIPRRRHERGLERVSTDKPPSSLATLNVDYSHPFYWAAFVLSGEWK